MFYKWWRQVNWQKAHLYTKLKCVVIFFVKFGIVNKSEGFLFCCGFCFLFSQKAYSLFSKNIKFLMCIYVLPARTCVLYVYLVCRDQYITSGSLEMKMHMVVSCHVGNGDWALVLYMKSNFSAAGPPLHLITYGYCYLEKNFLFLKAKECCSSSKAF